jgi:hypothetical protein
MPCSSPTVETCFGHIASLTLLVHNSLKIKKILLLWASRQVGGVGSAHLVIKGAAAGTVRSMVSRLRFSFGAAARVVVILLLASGASGILAGCASHALIDSLPASVGGLPEAARERPATPPIYPDVHDMPPSRSEAPLNEADRKKLKDNLIATRERNARKGGVPATTGSTRTSGTSRDP